jgi:glutamate formiminotransferase
VLECVINISEGRNAAVISQIAAAASACLLDVHSDPHHHRSVLTIGGPSEAVEEAARLVAARTVELVDLSSHVGVHPRFGALDVVPFVPLDVDGSPMASGGDLTPAIAARDRFAQWAGANLRLPCFLYGPQRTLPDLRRHVWITLTPDSGPAAPHRSAGACAVGARGVLLAYNLWLDGGDAAVALAIARALRGPSIRALGLHVGGTGQVSCNLIDPDVVGPVDAYDTVKALARGYGTAIARAELVGLAPQRIVNATPRKRWTELGLDPSLTIESRLEGEIRRQWTPN